MDPTSTIPVTPQDASNAASNYQVAQGAANTSGEQDISLPQLLQQSLSTKAFPTNDPQVQQQASDLTNYQQVLQNGATDPGNQTVTLPNGASVPLSGSAQLTAMSDQQRNAAAPLNMDNLLLALRGQGFSTVLKNIAATHAQETQKLVDSAQTAYQTWQTTLNALSQKANLALGYSQLGATMKGLDIQQQQADLAKQQLLANPTYQKQIVYQELTSDAASGKSWNELLQKYGTNPNVSQADIQRAWTNANQGKAPPATAAQRQQNNIPTGQGFLPTAWQDILNSLGLSGNNSQDANRPGLQTFLK